MIETISETLLIWVILSVAVAIVAWVMRSFPVSIVSSFGMFISGMKYYQDENPDLFVLGMAIMLAFAVPMAVAGRRSRRG